MALSSEEKKFVGVWLTVFIGGAVGLVAGIRWVVDRLIA
jgi:hypothetical protein